MKTALEQRRKTTKEKSSSRRRGRKQPTNDATDPTSATTVDYATSPTSATPINDATASASATPFNDNTNNDEDDLTTNRRSSTRNRVWIVYKARIIE